MSKKFDRISGSPEAGQGNVGGIHSEIKSRRLEVIATADDEINITEPSSAFHSEYPWNKAEQTLSGHLRETDDTPGAERISEMHRTGTFYEIHPDGRKVTKIVGDDFYICLEDHNLVVGGNLNITVQGNANLLVKGNLKQKVGGNLETTVHGDMITRVHGKSLLYSKGNLDIQSGESVGIKSTSIFELSSDAGLDMFSKGSMRLKTSSVGRFYAESSMWIDGQTLHWNEPGANPGEASKAFTDPGPGLEVSESVTEPSMDDIKLLNLGIVSDQDDSMTYPKDRLEKQ